MPSSVTYGNKTYTLDDHGFLDPPDQWDEAFAEGMAKDQGIHDGLKQDHWNFIRYVRRKFLEEKTVPVVVLACSDNRMRLEQLRFLFPTGYHRGACRIAGVNYDFMYQLNPWLTYETSTMLRAEHRVTQMGYLKEFEQWNERFAELIAREWKLPQGLTDRHRSIIGFLRDYYRNNKNIPTVFETCKANGLDLGELRELFPDGYRRGACRMAGLPFFP